MPISSITIKALAGAFLVLAGFAAAPAVLAQPVTLERDAPLYAEARFESKVVTTLKQGAAGEVIGKSGAWLNLKTPDAAGWLLSFNVRYSTRSDSGAGQSGSGMVAPRQKVSVTSSIGIRGLGEEDLRQAQFNDGQVSLLDKYVASRADAEARAGASGLAAERVNYLGMEAP